METLIGNYNLTKKQQLNLPKVKVGNVTGYGYYSEGGKLVVLSHVALSESEITDIRFIVSQLDESEPEEITQKRARKRQLLDSLATLTGLTRKQVLKCLIEAVQDGHDD